MESGVSIRESEIIGIDVVGTISSTVDVSDKPDSDLEGVGWVGASVGTYFSSMEWSDEPYSDVKGVE